MCRRNTALLKARQAIAAHRIDRPVRHLGITSKLAASGDGLSAGPRKAQSSALAGALPGPAFASACLRKIVIPHDERIHIDRNRSERCFDQSRSFRALHVSLEGWQRADHAERQAFIGLQVDLEFTIFLQIAFVRFVDHIDDRA